MKNNVKLFIMFFILFISFFSCQHDAKAYKYKASDWDNFDIRTEYKKTTIEDIKKHVSSKGHGDSPLIKLYPSLVDAGLKNGINPDYLYAMAVMESSWGKSSLASKYNNFGGITCTKNHECVKSGRHTWSIFTSMDDYARTKAELLAGNLYFGDGRYTIARILDRYAPESDGNNLHGASGYITVIGQALESLGYNPSESSGKLTKSEGADYKDSEGTATEDKKRKVGSYKILDPYVINAKGYSEDSNVGISENASIIPMEMSYAFQVFSGKFLDICVLLGYIISAILIAYIAFVIILYVAIFRGHSFNEDLLNKFINIEGGNVYSRKTLFSLMGRCFLGILLIAFVLGNYHILVMAYIYQKIMEFIHFL